MPGDLRSSYTSFPLLFTYCAPTAPSQHTHSQRLLTSTGIVSGLASFYYKYAAKLGKESKFHSGKEASEESQLP